MSSSLNFGDRSWQGYFSEEGANSRTCPDGSWMTGIACRGSNCDRIAIECTAVTNRMHTGCAWTSSTYSEEQPPFYAGAGRYIRGIKCFGARCDNKKYFHCALT